MPGGDAPDWDYIYAHVITITGWTWEYLDWQMDLKRLSALTRYWDQNPALHQMVQAFLGIKGKTPSPVAQATDNSSSDLDEFLQMFSSAGGTAH